MMLYFGGGYFGLYFPLPSSIVPAPVFPGMEVRAQLTIPMQMVTLVTTRAVPVATATAQSMRVPQTLTAAMPLPSRATTIPMQVPTGAELERG